MAVVQSVYTEIFFLICEPIVILSILYIFLLLHLLPFLIYYYFFFFIETTTTNVLFIFYYGDWAESDL